MIEVAMLLDERLKLVLSDKNIHESQYKPANNGESVGLDLYYVGSSPLTLSPDKHNTLISTGLRVVIPKGYVGILKERGSVTKTPCVLRAGVIDPGYTGEVFVNMVALQDYVINPGDKLPVQLVVMACTYEFVPVTEDGFQQRTVYSQRKEGKIGSSN